MFVFQMDLMEQSKLHGQSVNPFYSQFQLLDKSSSILVLDNLYHMADIYLAYDGRNEGMDMADISMSQFHQP
jgi:hypothetical protein